MFLVIRFRCGTGTETKDEKNYVPNLEVQEMFIFILTG
jgi:hypothetical protein